MTTKQYTIRNIPAEVDRYLRQRAHLSGLSLNQVVVDELSEKVSKPSADLVSSLDWFIGNGTIGDDVTCAIDSDDKTQKQLVREEWVK